MLIPLEEHALLVFWTQLLVLVVTARSLGWIMRRMGLPRVIGELAAGVVLGPTLFGRVWPDGFEWFLPDDEAQSAALLAVAWVGIALLLVVTGFETDLALIKRLGRASASVTALSLLVPLVGGLVVGYTMPDQFLGADTSRGIYALFVALALSVSSLAVIAKILSELGLMRRDFGQITVAAGMANDVVGWLLLAIFAGLASSGTVSFSGVATTLAGMAAFVLVTFTVGQRVVDASLRQVRRNGPDLGGALTVAIITMLAMGVATQALGIEAVLGAFVAGVILHRSRFQQPEVLDRIERITQSFLAPVFFATAGLRVDLGLLDDSTTLTWAGIVLAVALVAKFIGAFWGARLAGQSNRAAVALGAGLNARGALEIVIATVGLSLGVLNDRAYTVIVLVPLVTTVVASVTLRWVVRDWMGSPEEQERLEREEALSRNVIVRTSRVLLPSKGGPASIAAAQVLQYTWPTESAATVLTVGRLDDADLDPLRNVLFDREVEFRVIESATDDRAVAAAVAAEAQLGYGAIAVGAATEHPGGLLSPMVDELLKTSPVPVVIVRRARKLERPLPPAFSRALVPVTGTQSSKAAQEVAFSISEDLGTEVVLTHVVNRTSAVAAAGLPRLFQRRRDEPEPEMAVAERLMAEATERAQGHGLEVRQLVRHGASTADEITRAAREVDADLVVVGAGLRNVDGRPFLGHNVETVLENCDATVVVVTLPRRAEENNHG